MSYGTGAGSALLDGPGLQVSTAEADGDLPPQPGSPDLRQSTFGATLDFIEALCDASSGLTAFAPVSCFSAVAFEECSKILFSALGGETVVMHHEDTFELLFGLQICQAHCLH